LLSCEKTGEPIDMPFGSWLKCVQGTVLDGSQDLTNPFAAVRGDKSAVRPFAKLLYTHVTIALIRPHHLRSIDVAYCDRCHT